MVSDKQEVLKELEINPLSLEHVSDALKNDPEVVHKAISKDCKALEFASYNLKKNREFIKQAMLRTKVEVFAFAAEELRSNENFVLGMSSFIGNVILHAADSLCNNKSFLLKLIEKDSLSILILITTKADEKIRNDEEIWLKLLSYRYNDISGVPVSLLDNPGFMQKVCTVHSHLISKVSPVLRRNKEFMLAIVAQNGLALEHASDELKNNLEVILRALKQNILALRFVAETIMCNPNFISEVIGIQCDQLMKNPAFRSEKLINRTKQTCAQLTHLAYREPNSDQLELLLQVRYFNRIGRLNLPLAKHETDPKSYKPVESCSSFSQVDTNLAKSIKKHFTNELALFEYSMFYPTSANIKGVIIDYYGGHHEKNKRSSLSLSSNGKFFVEDGYIVIQLLTHDNWQTIHQAEQCNAQNKAGLALMNKTLTQLLLFSQEVKLRFVGLPLIYYGESFGAFKGMLVNLLLSNKNNLNESKDIFSGSISVLDKIDNNIFDGYILHNGHHNDLDSLTIRDFKNPIQTPVLILQNFDDERVTLAPVLRFIKNQLDKLSSPEMISFHLTPQGSAKVVQVPEISGPILCSSLEGHFIPEPEKYVRDYRKAIRQFLSELGATKKTTKTMPHSLTRIRYTHAENLCLGTDVIKNRLYCLYYGLLHSESDNTVKINRYHLQYGEKKISPMAERVYRTLCLIAQNDWTKNKQKKFYELLMLYGPWLVASIHKKMTATLKCIMQDRKISPNQKSSLTVLKTDPLTMSSDENDFVLTPDALEHLQHYPNPLELIKRCKVFAIRIDKKILEFFIDHEILKNMNDFVKLWELPDSTAPNLNINLSEASRLMSILKVYYSKENLIEVLECVQVYSPLEVINCLGPMNLSITELRYFMNKLRELPELERRPFIGMIGRVVILPDNKLQMIDWLFKIDRSKREELVDRYLVAMQKLPEKFVREHLEILDKDFTKNASTLHEYMIAFSNK